MEAGAGASDELDFDPVHKRFLTAGGMSVRIWDYAGRPIRELKHDKGVGSASFSNDGRFIATGSADALVRIWDAESGTALRTLFGHSDWVNSTEFSRDGKLLLSSSSDRTAVVWRLDTGTVAGLIEGLNNDHSTAQFSPDATHVLVASGTLARVYHTAELLPQYAAFKSSWNAAAGFNRRGLPIVVDPADGAVSVRPFSTHARPESAPVSGVVRAALSASGDRVALARQDGTVSIWDAASEA